MVAFIRPEMKFDGIDALKAQIGADCATAKSALADAGSLNYIEEGFLRRRSAGPRRRARRSRSRAGRLGRRGPSERV